MISESRYYKAVRCNPRQETYESIIPGPHNVLYQVGQWTTAPIGGLLVFHDETAARYFMPSASPGFEALFLCDVEDPVELPPFRVYQRNEREVRSFLRDKSKPDLYTLFWDLAAVYKTHEDLVTAICEQWAGPIPAFVPWPSNTSAYRRVRLIYPIWGGRGRKMAGKLFDKRRSCYRPVLNLERDFNLAAGDEDAGFCLGCGEYQIGGVEPDARKYPCESCGERKVYGIPELLVMDLTVLV